MQEKTYNLFKTRKEIILCRSNEEFSVILKPLTEEEEQRIDKSKLYYGEIRYYESKDKYIVGRNIYMYGEINLDDDNDLDVIERFDLVPKDFGKMLINFDYDKGTYTTENGIAKTTFTSDPIEWFKYCYCQIGKPKRVIVYIRRYGYK